MAVGDVLELTTVSTLFGQNCVNVYFYAVSEQAGQVGNIAQRLCDAFVIRHWETLGSVFRTSIISEQVRYDICRVRNLFNEAQIYERLEALQTGSGTGETLPPFNAFSLKGDRTDGRIRRSYKRIVGMQEGSQVNGNLTQAAIDAMNLLGEQLVEELAYGEVPDRVVFSPVVVKRVKETDPVTGEVTYRLPENQGEAIYSQIMTYQCQPRVTSQVSRKS